MNPWKIRADAFGLKNVDTHKRACDSTDNFLRE